MATFTLMQIFILQILTLAPITIECIGGEETRLGSEVAISAKQRSILKRRRQAVLEFVTYANEGDFDSIFEIVGSFVKHGAHFGTEGQIIQVDQNTICQETKGRKQHYPNNWIAYYHLLESSKRGNGCSASSSVSQIVEQIFKSGARAVIIPLHKNHQVFQELHSMKMYRPVVIVNMSDALKIETIVKDRQNNFVRIKARRFLRKRTHDLLHRKDAQENEYIDMGIFMAFFIVVALICLILLIKIKWRQNRKKNSRTKIAVEALQTMQVRKHVMSKEMENNVCDSLYGIRHCAVCLEELENGKDIRILPCNHEFHLCCIDPWLVANYTCPLCMYSIIGTKKHKSKPQRTHIIPQFIARRFQSTPRLSSRGQELANEQQQDDEPLSPPSINETPNYPTMRNSDTVLPNGRFPVEQHNGTKVVRGHRCPFHNKTNPRKCTGHKNIDQTTDEINITNSTTKPSVSEFPGSENIPTRHQLSQTGAHKNINNLTAKIFSSSCGNISTVKISRHSAMRPVQSVASLELERLHTNFL